MLLFFIVRFVSERQWQSWCSENHVVCSS